MSNDVKWGLEDYFPPRINDSQGQSASWQDDKSIYTWILFGTPNDGTFHCDYEATISNL